MNDDILYKLCDKGKWPEVLEYLSSNATDEAKTRNVMHLGLGAVRPISGISLSGFDEWPQPFTVTCLHLAACSKSTEGINRRCAPADVVKALLNIGGKELVMMTDEYDLTALHNACRDGTSYDGIKTLIDVGGKDLVMVEDCGFDDHGATALHYLCSNIYKHSKVADKIKLLLEVGDANFLLSTKDIGGVGKTPLQHATEKRAATSNRIKNLLTPSSNSTNNTNNSSSNIVPAYISFDTPIKQSNHNQQTTSQSNYTINDPNETARKLQAQLKKAQEQSKQIRQDYDQKLADYNILQDTLQLECTEKPQLASGSTKKGKSLHESNKLNKDHLEQENKQSKRKIKEAEGVNAILREQKKKSESDDAYWKEGGDNLTQICWGEIAKLEEMKVHESEANAKRKYDHEEDSTLVSQSFPKRNIGNNASSSTTVHQLPQTLFKLKTKTKVWG